MDIALEERSKCASNNKKNQTSDSHPTQIVAFRDSDTFLKVSLSVNLILHTVVLYTVIFILDVNNIFLYLLFNYAHHQYTVVFLCINACICCYFNIFVKTVVLQKHD